MRLLFFLVWKNWRSSPLRIGITWFGVALGVAIVTAVHVLDHNTILSQLERKRGDFGRVDFELRPRAPGASLDRVLARLRARPDLDRVGVLGQTVIRLTGPDRREASVVLFGPGPVGERSEVVTLTLRSTGQGRLQIGDIRIEGAEAREFRLVAGTCQGLPYLVPGGDCSVGVRFTPGAPGERRAVVVIEHNAQGGTREVELVGSGL